jgi:protein NirF
MKTMLAVALCSTVVACQGTRTGAERAGPSAEPAAEASSVAPARAPAGGVGSRVFVVERDTESLGIYDLIGRRYVPRAITGLGNMRHATMTFSPDLRWGYVATKSGKLSRIDLEKVERAGDVEASNNSIDIAISQDGRWVATAEYHPGGVTIMDAQTLAVVARLPAEIDKHGNKSMSRATGIVDAPGNRFVCVLIEGAEIWVIDASGSQPHIERREKLAGDQPYDAMITPDGRHYVVGHMGSEAVSVLDVSDANSKVMQVSLRDPRRTFQRGTAVKLPHMAAWAVAGDNVFVPLVGEPRVVVLDRKSWAFKASVPVRGHPVYSVASPSGREVWVSFSGDGDDAWLDVIDAEKLAVKTSLKVGARVYHLDFTPRGGHVLVSANKDNKVVLVDASTYSIVDEQPVHSPSGIFGVWRAFRVGL